MSGIQRFVLLWCIRFADNEVEWMLQLWREITTLRGRTVIAVVKAQGDDLTEPPRARLENSPKYPQVSYCYVTKEQANIHSTGFQGFWVSVLRISRRRVCNLQITIWHQKHGIWPSSSQTCDFRVWFQWGNMSPSLLLFQVVLLFLTWENEVGCVYCPIYGGQKLPK